MEGYKRLIPSHWLVDALVFHFHLQAVAQTFSSASSKPDVALRFLSSVMIDGTFVGWESGKRHQSDGYSCLAYQAPQDRRFLSRPTLPTCSIMRQWDCSSAPLLSLDENTLRQKSDTRNLRATFGIPTISRREPEHR